MKKISFILISAISFTLFGCQEVKTSIENTSDKAVITMETLLDEMISRDEMTRFPAVAYNQKQVSSYDRRSVAPTEEGWFANDDGAGYERLDTIRGRIEKVMFDEQGPGVITRIWMTTKEKFGTIRIYLDGGIKPQIVIPAYDMRRFPITIPEGLSLTHTHYVDDMAGVGGNTFFLPIPYNKSCKITFEEPDITVKIPRYYHIGYRVYPQGTNIKTYSVREVKQLSTKIASVSDELLNPSKVEGALSSVQVDLKKGASAKLQLPEGERAIYNLKIKIEGFGETDYADIMRGLQLRLSFDGVECAKAPLADFSGGGIGAPEVKSWSLCSDGKGEIICRWVMPYQKSAEIVVYNSIKKSVSVAIEALTDTYNWDSRSLYFHCSHRSQESIPLNNNYNTNDNLDWNFMTITGRGLYVGDILSLYNHAIDWYGEGDEKIWIDEDTFPSHFGTGTEDYFNCSWAPVVVFLTPYGGAPRADEESSHGYNTFMRTRNLDAIPFNTLFKFDIEMLSWHLGTADYYATSYWYGDIDAVANSNQ